jgi:NADH:ubiquinone oxidoreductase subunit 3 (subunit A)
MVQSDDRWTARSTDSGTVSERVARAWRTGTEGSGGVVIERIIIATFVVLGAVFVAATLGASWLLSPKKPSAAKSETYECGVEPMGPPWVRFHAGYYVYALLFVIFDIETVFLYPWALVFGQPASGWFVFAEMVIFVTILVGGLAYAWKEGALRWH